MKTEKFDGSVGSMWGEKFNPPIKFNGTYEAFESYDELKAANELPTNDECVDFRNNQRKNNERQKAMLEALAEKGHTKPDPNDPIVVARNMIANVEKMENMKSDMKQLMIAGLRQQIADEEVRRKAAKDAAAVPDTV